MFLSSTLTAIYANNPRWSKETCNLIIHAVADKCKEEIQALCDIAAKQGSIKASVAYAAIDRQVLVFSEFAKDHPDMPSILIETVNELLASYRKIIDNIVNK